MQRLKIRMSQHRQRRQPKIRVIYIRWIPRILRKAADEVLRLLEQKPEHLIRVNKVEFVQCL